MVKGISRQVIVVDSPDPELFEQAIFIVRKNTLKKDGISQDQLVTEACRVARSYCRSQSGRRRLFSLRTSFFCGAIGVGGVLIGWLSGTIIGI